MKNVKYLHNDVPVSRAFLGVCPATPGSVHAIPSVIAAIVIVPLQQILAAT
jgi:hypothetical protein